MVCCSFVLVSQDSHGKTFQHGVCTEITANKYYWLFLYLLRSHAVQQPKIGQITGNWTPLLKGAPQRGAIRP